MNRRENERQDVNPFEESDHSARSRRDRPKRKRRWPLLLLLLIAFVGLLPNLLGWTGLHQSAIDFALSEFDGKVKVEKVSLGWFQPVILTGISATDVDGQPLLEIKQVTTSIPVYRFLTSSDYGELTIENPVAHVHLRPDGSNFEDACASYFEPSAETDANLSTTEPTALPRIAIRVVDGSVTIVDQADPRLWRVDGVQMIVSTNTSESPLQLEAVCGVTPVVPDANGQPVAQAGGGVALTSRLDPGSAVLELGSLQLAIETNDLPISVLGPLVQRFTGPTQATGMLTGKLESRVDLNRQSIAVRMEGVSLNRAGVVAPELLGSDQIQFDHLRANGSLEISPQTIASSSFLVESDFGKVSANGSFNLNQLSELATGGSLPTTPLHVDGEIDLAGLVRMLPTTLKLHEDLQIESGTVRVQVGTQGEADIQRLVMNLDTANLKAHRGNKPIVWQQPLRLVTTIIQSPSGTAIEDLLFESDFLSVAGNATPETGVFRAQGDLTALMQKMGQFADLSGIELAGKLDGNFGWQTAVAPSGKSSVGYPIQIGGSFVVDQPVLRFPEMPVWKQQRLSVKMSGAGHSLKHPQTGQRVLSLEQGGVQLNLGTEQTVATLAEPVRDAFADVWNLDCQLSGDLGGWLHHLQNFVDLGDVEARGKTVLDCRAQWNGDRLALNNINYSVEEMEFFGYGMTIREPKVTGTATAKCDLSTGATTIVDSTLTASSIAARGQNLTLMYDQYLDLEGAIAFRADLNRVADWIELSPTDDSVFWFGSAAGTVFLDSDESGVHGQLNSTITDLVAAQRARAASSEGPLGAVQTVSSQTQWTELFRETESQLESNFVMGHDWDSISFQKMTLASSSVQVEGAGSVSELSSTMETDFKGSWNPDWNKVRHLLSAYVGELVKLSGTGRQPFKIRGPLFVSDSTSGSSAWLPPRMVAETSVRWDEGELLGVPVGPSELKIDVRNSVGRIRTEGISFSGGVMKLAPDVDLRGEQPILVMEQTRVIDRVALSAETARNWMKYVAPLVADATNAKGTITLDSQSLRVPVYDPMALDANGTVRLTDVVIGAGPLADQLLGTVQQVRRLLKPDASERDLNTWLTMSEQTIPVRVKDRRVYHENVTFRHNDTVVRTRGSVGFDQSLNLMAEIPIADDWIEGNSYLAGLKGRSLSIPIGGTVTQPKMDKRAIEDLTKNLVKTATAGAVNQAISDKVNPTIGEFQEKVNGKINNELNKFQQKLGEKLGGEGGLPNLRNFIPGQNNGTPATSRENANPSSSSAAGDPNGSQENELLKGIENLFGR